MPKITLYVPCYNAASTLVPCLEGIASLRRKPDELFIIDDGCTDDTAAIAKRLGVRVIPHGTNRGLAAGRNTAIRNASHELIASLDSDCVPKPGWLEILERRLGDDESLAGVGGMLVETNRTELADRWRTMHMRQHWGGLPIPNPAFLFGNNTLFRKKALLEAGLYNEKLRTNFEDVAISEALYRAGYALYYDPDAIVHHLRRDTLKSVLRANWRWRFFGYRNDIDVRGTARAISKDRVQELLYFLKDDVRARDVACGVLSSAAIGYAVACDLKHLLGHYGERRIHDPSS